MADKKRENKRKATIKKLKKNKYYYAFVAIVLIIAIVVVFLDYNFRFGIINWGVTTESSSESERGSYGNTNVDELGDLTVKFLDVGQGDAIFITFPDNKTMLVDAGNDGSSVEKVLAENLLVDGQKPIIDYAVLTHSDADHVGSMAYVYNNYEVKKSYRPYENSVGNVQFPDGFNLGFNDIDTKVYKNYLSSLLAEGTEWEFFTDQSEILRTVTDQDGDCIKYTVDFFMPYITSVESFSSFGDSNNMSSVMIIEFAGVKIMLTGDMEKDAEEAFVSYFDSNADKKSYVDCDILKLGHHGSATSSSYNFLSLVKPEHAVISCGVCHGTYMHPRAEALNNLNAIQSTLSYSPNDPKGLYRTDLQGTVVLTVKPSGEFYFTVETNEFDEYLLYDAYELEPYKDQIKDFKESL